MSGELAHASLVENARFNSTVVIPNAVQGIFRRRRLAVQAATLAGVDGQAVGLLEGMSRSYGGGPVWVKLMRDNALLLLAPDDVGRALEQSPDPFASDPKAKRDGMVHFQPDALTISRGEDWASRRRFAEAVLGATPMEHAAEVTREEIGQLLLSVRGGDQLTWDPWNRALQRITRRVVLGEAAAGDWALSETLGNMMSGANGMPGSPSVEVESFERRIAAYMDRAEEGSLAAIARMAPVDERTKASGQLTHWLFALGDTLAVNALRAVVMLANHEAHLRRALSDESGAYVDACLHEAMRLWPTTTILSRVSLAPTNWNGERVPAGTQLVIVNTYSHRDRERLDFADRLAPEEWIDGDASSYPGFNAFSRGPQGCPGSALSILVGRTAIRAVIERGVHSPSPRMDPAKPMPHMLDYFGASVRLS